jgi:hypothetical protein
MVLDSQASYPAPLILSLFIHQMRLVCSLWQGKGSVSWERMNGFMNELMTGAHVGSLLRSGNKS